MAFSAVCLKSMLLRFRGGFLEEFTEAFVIGSGTVRIQFDVSEHGIKLVNVELKLGAELFKRLIKAASAPQFCWAKISWRRGSPGCTDVERHSR